ncbi:hypothetical protein EXN66_Car017527 [Channa argus]|uniref:Tc1-like transposase DDE domain-containing protein n=1 Tax=Channa argus TaxID=215402 RepID=A0A6G1QHH4_CHAAH|nr:hypothetical protein EXN66_Car017527 [Channa argus]
MAPGCIMGRKQPGRSSAMLLATFCSETLDPVFHVDVALTWITYLKIFADQVDVFMETVFPDGSSLFQQDHAPGHTAKWFKEHKQSTEHLVDVMEKTSPIHGLQGSATNSWVTLRGLLESIAQSVSAVLVAEMGPILY